MDAELQDESVELLQAMIRNACVNDGRVESGEEIRNSDLLETYLEGSGLDIQTYDSAPGRRSIVSRIEGSDPNAPTLCLMGHTDVVPVSPDGWSRDPFGGDIVDGEIWGRGAIDMLNLTATQAVVFKHLARSGFKPKGTLLFFGVADEEAGGTWGARWMADNHWDDIAADYVLTEMGGIPMPSNDGPRRITITVGEKGIAWRRLTVKGTPGHGSMPFGADNALIKSAEIVKRLAEYRPASRIDDIWEKTVRAYELPHDITAGLLDPDRIWETFEKVEPARGKLFHACTHTTFSPNVLHGGVKTNVIPDSVEIDVDIRTVVGTTAEDVDAHLREAIGDELAESVEISALFNDEASISPMGTPMWDSLLRRSQQVYPGAEFVPQLLVGATDSRFYREKGSVAYGTGLYSPNVTWEQWASRFHGHDERIDIASLGLTSDLWLGVIEDMIT